MGFVTEEIEHEELPVKLMTVERDKESGECREPWRFISLEFDHFENLTPPELRRLGRWLVQEGKRIGKEYKSNGAMKTPSNAIGQEPCAAVCARSPAPECYTSGTTEKE